MKKSQTYLSLSAFDLNRSNFSGAMNLESRTFNMIHTVGIIARNQRMELDFCKCHIWHLLDLKPRDTSLIGKSVRDFFRTKGFIRIFDGFFLKKKDFCQRCTRFLGVKCPSP